MELRQYWRIARRRAWLVLVLMVIGGGSSAYVSFLQVKQYQATTSLAINPVRTNGVDPYLAAFGQTNPQSAVVYLANSYGELLKSRKFNSIIVKQMNLNVSPDDLSGRISSALVPNTNKLTVTLLWPDPQQAADIANNIATTFVGWKDIQQQSTITSTSTLPGAAGQATNDITTSLNYYHSRVISLRASIDALNSSTLPAIDKETQGATLAQELALMEQAYKGYQDEAQTQVGQDQASAQVIDEAIPDYNVVTPRTSRNIGVGVLAALILGIALAFLMEYLDNTIKSPDEVESLSGYTALGTISVINSDDKEKGKRKRRKKNAEALPDKDAIWLQHKLVSVGGGQSRYAEAFRAIRTNIRFATIDNPPRSLVVTSAAPSEGKSLVSANTAVTMAQQGQRVLLVDADLHRPNVHKIFEIPSTTGFTNLMLRNDVAMADVIVQSKAHENLYLLPTGPLPPNPAELFGSKRFSEVLAELKESFDLIIFDAPPAGPLTDPLVIASQVDGTILVVRAGSTRRDMIRGLAQALQRGNIPVVGVVLNMVTASTSRYYGYGYYGYYGYGNYGYERKDIPPPPDGPVSDDAGSGPSVSDVRRRVNLAHLEG